MASNMNRGYVGPHPTTNVPGVPPPGPVPGGPPPPGGSSSLPVPVGPPAPAPQSNMPPQSMIPGGPPPPPMGPGMRTPERPMPMQHGTAPPGRQFNSPGPGYQPQPPRPTYPSGPPMGMQGTPPPPQGMHGRMGQSMPPPPNPYGPGRMPPQGPMGMEASRKRPAPGPESRVQNQPQPKREMWKKEDDEGLYKVVRPGTSRVVEKSTRKNTQPPGVMPVPSNTSSASGNVMSSGSKKKKKLADKILPQKVRDLVPESQAYMDLLAFERKLDFTIMRKRLDIQEALKRPMKQKKKLRIFISNTFYPGKQEGDGAEEPTVPSWELRVEGRLLDDPSAPKSDQSKVKRKFSSFFKSLVIELDKELYGPDNHLVEWHRTPTTTETDGFQVKRPGDKNVRCTILLLLDYQPLQFKLDPRLARLLGIHTQTRPMIISALWQYIKTHKLQDPHEREYVNCDKYLEQIFQCARMKFAEIPSRLHQLLHPPDPIVINHVISVEGPDTKKTACYDIDVEVDDPLKTQMNNFVLSTASQQEIQSLDNKIHETVETINQLKTNREFFLSFAKDPQQFINKWLISQMRDLKTMTDVVGNPEEERRSDFYFQPWAQEAVCRYFYAKVQQKRAELEQALGIRNA